MLSELHIYLEWESKKWSQRWRYCNGCQFQSFLLFLSARSARNVPRFRILTSILRIIPWFYELTTWLANRSVRKNGYGESGIKLFTTFIAIGRQFQHFGFTLLIGWMTEVLRIYRDWQCSNLISCMRPDWTIQWRGGYFAIWHWERVSNLGCQHIPPLLLLQISVFRHFNVCIMIEKTLLKRNYCT